MSIETRVADVTVRAADPVVEPEPALMFVEPVATPVARPVPSIVAIFVAVELQAALFVMSVVLPSEKIPFAANGCVAPISTEAVDGVTRIELSSTDVTVPAAEALVVPSEAVTVAEPAATPVASPDVLTVRKLVAFELHVTCEVMSCVVPSL